MQKYGIYVKRCVFWARVRPNKNTFLGSGGRPEAGRRTATFHSGDRLRKSSPDPPRRYASPAGDEMQKKWERAGVLRELRSRSFYIKPSDEKREAAKKAARRKARMARIDALRNNPRAVRRRRTRNNNKNNVYIFLH